MQLTQKITRGAARLVEKERKEHVALNEWIEKREKWVSVKEGKLFPLRPT